MIYYGKGLALVAALREMSQGQSSLRELSGEANDLSGTVLQEGVCQALTMKLSEVLDARRRSN